jgi:hypothetical protein
MNEHPWKSALSGMSEGQAIWEIVVSCERAGPAHNKHTVNVLQRLQI